MSTPTPPPYPGVDNSEAPQIVDQDDAELHFAWSAIPVFIHREEGAPDSAVRSTNLPEKLGDSFTYGGDDNAYDNVIDQTVTLDANFVSTDYTEIFAPEVSDQKRFIIFGLPDDESYGGGAFATLYIGDANNKFPLGAITPGQSLMYPYVFEGMDNGYPFFYGRYVSQPVDIRVIAFDTR